jgi:hypothetical protein
VLYLRLIILLVVGGVPIDNETLFVINFVNLRSSRPSLSKVLIGVLEFTDFPRAEILEKYPKTLGKMFPKKLSYERVLGMILTGKRGFLYKYSS